MKRTLLVFVLCLMALSMRSQNQTVPEGYVDLGLPSGTLWKASNESGFYGYDAAIKVFGIGIPSKEQWEELKNVCKWEWKDRGYNINGPNGKSIVLPAEGHRGCDGRINELWSYGHYWSTTRSGSLSAWNLVFYSGEVFMGDYDNRCLGFSVRLVQPNPDDYIDLGLPSGTLWKSSNEEGFYSYNSAIEKYGIKLPSKKQWEELEDNCKWMWVGDGCVVVGPNGRSILLPAAGYQGCDGVVDDVLSYGYYWSTTRSDFTAWNLFFFPGEVTMANDNHPCLGLSVRLVQD